MLFYLVSSQMPALFGQAENVEMAKTAFAAGMEAHLNHPAPMEFFLSENTNF